MGNLEQRVNKLEKRKSIRKNDYSNDCIIEITRPLSAEEIDRIMEERFKRSGTKNFILLPSPNLKKSTGQ